MKHIKLMHKRACCNEPLRRLTVLLDACWVSSSEEKKKHFVSLSLMLRPINCRARVHTHTHTLSLTHTHTHTHTHTLTHTHTQCKSFSLSLSCAIVFESIYPSEDDLFLQHLRSLLLSDQGSISSMCLRAAFTWVGHKSKKKLLDLTVFFALLGYAHVKAACKMLVKLTTYCRWSFFF